MLLLFISRSFCDCRVCCIYKKKSDCLQTTKREKNLFINNILIHLNKLKQTIRPVCLSVFVAVTHKVGVVVTICVCFLCVRWGWWEGGRRTRNICCVANCLVYSLVFSRNSFRGQILPWQLYNYTYMHT